MPCRVLCRISVHYILPRAWIQAAPSPAAVVAGVSAKNLSHSANPAPLGTLVTSMYRSSSIAHALQTGSRQLHWNRCSPSWNTMRPFVLTCSRVKPSFAPALRMHRRTIHSGVPLASGAVPIRRAKKPGLRKPEGWNYKMEPESREYWERCLRNLTRSDARDLKLMLNMDHVIGVKMVDGASLPLFSEFCRYKQKYPLHLIVIQIGSFYETVGIDAVMLVEHAGLNAMSKQAGIPRAGFPAVNLNSMLTRLVTENGFSVVVVEQEASPNSAKQQLKRYVGGIVTPAKPHYIHGTLQTMGHEVYDVVKPIVALASSKNGYQVLELRLDNYVLTVHDGLNEEALVAQVYASGVAPPLYVHNSVFSIKHGNNFEDRLRGALVSDVAGSMRKFRGENVVDSLLNLVRHEHGLGPAVHIEQVKSSTDQGPRPLYMSTVNQMGLNPTVKYVPPLLDKMVQLTEKPLHKASKLWLRRLLLCPPPLHVAAALRQICQILSSTSKPMPTFAITMPPNQVIDMLTQQEATAGFFRDLTVMLVPVCRTVMNPDLQDISNAVLHVVGYDRGVTMSSHAVGASCQEAIANMAAVIAAQDEDDLEVAEEEGVTGEGALSEDGNSSGEEEGREGGPRSTPLVLAQVRRIWERNLRGKIKPSLLEEEMLKVEEAYAGVAELVQSVLAPMLMYARNHGFKEKEMPRCIYDSDIELLRIILPGNTKLTQQSVRDMVVDKKYRLEPCKDGRRNARKSERYLSRKLDDSFSDYVVAVQDAQQKVRTILKSLAEQMNDSLSAHLVAVQFAIIMAALTAHVSSATRLGWCLPQAASTDVSSRGSLVLEGMWPYWWGPEESGEAVKNSITLDSMVLLTGPNMAGKSTVLRTLCAVALLGSCGLMAPAERAVVPYIDSFVLRNFSGDSPIEKKSAFALEMHEMRFVLEDMTPHSLVLVDELGKGTDHDSGEAISGAILEDLDRCGCRGVFATHFHGLVDMKENDVIHVPATQLYQMEVNIVNTPGGPDTQPTFRMAPGSNSRTLAFSVARNEGLNDALVHRAFALFNRQDPQRMKPRLESPKLTLTSKGSGSKSLQSSAAFTQSVDLGTPQQTWQLLQDIKPLLRSTAQRVLAAQMQHSMDNSGTNNGQENGHGNSNGSSNGSSNGDGSGNGNGDGIGNASGNRSGNGLATGSSSEVIGSGNVSSLDAENVSANIVAAGSVAVKKRARKKRIAAGDAVPIGLSDSECTVSTVAETVVSAIPDVPVEVYEVSVGDSPPSAHLSRACVYVACWEDGLCHAGETEDIVQRHHQHRTRTRRDYKGSMSMVYVVLPLREGGKSLARQVEAELTRELRGRGLPLRGTGKDAGNMKFARR